MKTLAYNFVCFLFHCTCSEAGENTICHKMSHKVQYHAVNGCTSKQRCATVIIVLAVATVGDLISLKKLHIIKRHLVHHGTKQEGSCLLSTIFPSLFRAKLT